jgi:hypothetical protein
MIVYLLTQQTPAVAVQKPKRPFNNSKQWGRPPFCRMDDDEAERERRVRLRREERERAQRLAEEYQPGTIL